MTDQTWLDNYEGIRFNVENSRKNTIEITGKQAHVKTQLLILEDIKPNIDFISIPYLKNRTFASQDRSHEIAASERITVAMQIAAEKPEGIKKELISLGWKKQGKRYIYERKDK